MEGTRSEAQSSNLAPSGETGNGNHLIMIEDHKIAVSYAIEAIRVFDHLHIRSRMRDAIGGTKKTKKAKTKPSLQKPRSISGRAAWFEKFYVSGSQSEGDRLLFSR